MHSRNQPDHQICKRSTLTLWVPRTQRTHIVVYSKFLLQMQKKTHNKKQQQMINDVLCCMYSQRKQEAMFASTKLQPIQSVNQSNQSHINKDKQSQIKKSESSDSQSIQFVQNQQSPYKQQPYSQLQKNEQEKQQKQQYEKTLTKLKNQLNTTTLFLRLFEFARIQFQKTLMYERDQQCPLCILPFSLIRKPMMICLQQHLVCDVCLYTVKRLHNCPLCRELICIEKVSVYRQGLNLLQIDKYFNEKVRSKYNRFERFNQETKDQSFNDKLAHELIQTQGNCVNKQNKTKRKYFAVRHDQLKLRANKNKVERSSQNC